MIESHISQIIRTSIIGIVANVLLASFKAVVGILALGYGRIEYSMPSILVNSPTRYSRMNRVCR